MKYFYSAYVYEDCGLNCPSPVVALEVGMGGGGRSGEAVMYSPPSQTRLNFTYKDSLSLQPINRFD